MALHAQWEDDELPQLQELLQRALNTWEPKLAPKWAWELDAKVQARITARGVHVAARPHKLMELCMATIQIAEDLQVRVPDDRLPLGTRDAVFHTFKAGTNGNWVFEDRDGTHRIHKFSANAGKYGILTYMCVTELCDPPSWL